VFAEAANHGFARANNIAARHARGKYFLLLNPDTVILDRAIDRLVAFAEAAPAARIWGGRTIYGDHRLNPSNCWRQMSLWSLFSQAAGLSSLFRKSPLFNPDAYPDWARDSERSVEIVTGCFFLIRRLFWEELGGFDLTFVMYGEEADLCQRAARAGARPRITPAAEIIHYVGASSSVRANKQVMVLKAKATLIRRYFPAWQQPIALALLRVWPASRALVARIAAGLTGRAGPTARAEAWGEVWRRRTEWHRGYPVAPEGQQA
jgi:GT2 family glycosyltransferase